MKASYGSQSEEEGLAFVPPTPRTMASRRSNKRVMVGASLALLGAAAATGALMAFVNPDDLSTLEVAPMQLQGSALIESLAAEIGIDDDATFETLDANSDGTVTKDEYVSRLNARRDQVLNKLTQSNLADDAKGPIATLIQDNFDSEAACIGNVFNLSGGRNVDKATFEFVHPLITSLCKKSLSLDSSALKKAVEGTSAPPVVSIDGDLTTPATEGPPVSIDGQPAADVTIDGDMPVPTMIPNGDGFMATTPPSTESDDDDNEDSAASPVMDDSSGVTETSTPATSVDADDASTIGDAVSQNQANTSNDVAGNDEGEEEDETTSPGGDSSTPATESPVSGDDTGEKDTGEDDETTTEDSVSPSPAVANEDDNNEEIADDDSSTTTAPSVDETPAASDTQGTEGSSEDGLPSSGAPSVGEESSQEGDSDTESPLPAPNDEDTTSPPGGDTAPGENDEEEEPTTDSPGLATSNETPDNGSPDIDENDGPETDSPGVVVDDQPETNSPGVVVDDEPETNSPGVVINDQPETNTPGVVVNDESDSDSPSVNDDDEPDPNSPDVTVNDEQGTSSPGVIVNGEPVTNSPGVVVITGPPETISPGVIIDDFPTEVPSLGDGTTTTPWASPSTATGASLPSTEGTQAPPAGNDNFLNELQPRENTTREEQKSPGRIAFENALAALFEKELSDREQRLAYAKLEVEKNSFMIELIHTCISKAGRQFEFDSSFSQDLAVEWIRTQCMAFPDVFHHPEHF